jgi:hypothetical protein
MFKNNTTDGTNENIHLKIKHTTWELETSEYLNCCNQTKFHGKLLLITV